MILWINLVTNGLLALALGVDPPDSTQMRRATRESERRGCWGHARLAGDGVRRWRGWGRAAILCYLLHSGRPIWSPTGTVERAIAFSLLALSPLFHAYNCRSATASFFSLRPMLAVDPRRCRWQPVRESTLSRCWYRGFGPCFRRSP